MSKDAIRSSPVRKETYELEERLKNNANHVLGFLV